MFSAGCVLFELLTGAVYKQAKRRKQGLADLRPETPEWLVEVVARALARDADDRYADAGEMGSRIETGQRIEARANRSGQSWRLAAKQVQLTGRSEGSSRGRSGTAG